LSSLGIRGIFCEMKVLVTGANGQLGTDLCLALHDFEVIPLTHEDIEVTSIYSVWKNISKYKPNVVINSAAYVRVDDCEDHVDECFKVDALGAKNVAIIT